MQRGVITLSIEEVEMITQTALKQAELLPTPLVSKFKAAVELKQPSTRLELSEDEAEEILDFIDFDPSNKEITSLRGKIQSFLSGLRG